MLKLEKLYFLVHGFCWACIGAHSPSLPADRLQRYLEREAACVRGWYAGLETLQAKEALAVIPFGPSSASAAFYARAASVLGDRLLILDAPDCLAPGFWKADNQADTFAELQAAFMLQGYSWNKEELHTALHAGACCQQLAGLLEQRGLFYDPATLKAETWGASYEGCVTKYSLNLSRILGLQNMIDINYRLTVPDAEFLLPICDCRVISLANNLHLHIFNSPEAKFALFVHTSQSLADTPARVSIPAAPDILLVTSKQGIRLWPDPEKYVLPQAPLGCFEPAQQVVSYRDGQLRVPVSAGYVYRLAKAPAFISCGPGTTCRELESILMGARITDVNG